MRCVEIAIQLDDIDAGLAAPSESPASKDTPPSTSQKPSYLLRPRSTGHSMAKPRFRGGVAKSLFINVLRNSWSAARRPAAKHLRNVPFRSGEKTRLVFQASQGKFSTQRRPKNERLLNRQA